MNGSVVNVGNPVNRGAALNRGLLFWLRLLPNRMGRRLVDICGGYSAALGSTQTYGGMQWGSQGIRGGNTYANFGTAFNSKISTAITIAAIHTPKTMSSYAEILACNNNSGTYPYGLRTTPTAKAECYGNSHGGSTLTTGATTLAAGRTYHLCFTVGAVNGVRLYVDGIQDASNTYSGASMSTAVGNGFLGFVGGFSNDGLCSDVRVYTRELLPSQVKQLYLAARTGYRTELNWIDSDALYGATAAATGNRRRRVLMRQS